MVFGIKLKELECVGVWKYNLPNGTTECQICKRNIMAPSPQDMQDGKIVGTVSVGQCGHSYHSHCINKYVEKNVSCPIDMTEWKQVKKNKNKNTNNE